MKKTMQMVSRMVKNRFAVGSPVAGCGVQNGSYLRGAAAPPTRACVIEEWSEDRSPLHDDE